MSQGACLCRHHGVMRAAFVIGLAFAVTLACGPAAQVAPTTSAPAPSPEPTASLSLAPPTAAPSPVLTPPPPQPTPPPVAPVPHVRVQTGTFALTPLPPPFEASGQISIDAAAMVKGWIPMYLEMLDKYRANSSPETKQSFESWIAPGPYVEVVRRSLGDLYSGGNAPATRSLVLTKQSVDHVWAKPWGRPAYIDATIEYDDKITTGSSTKTEPHLSRVRLVNQGQGFLKVIDGFDPVLGRWINGDSPRYSAPALEAELGDAAAYILSRDSYVKDEQYPHSAIATGVTVRLPTPFGKSWEAAINVLDQQYLRGDFVERRFDDAVARILTFEPATFIGDGVVTVRVDSKVVTINKAGVSQTVPSTRMLRFYRITRDGTNAGWALIDEQGPNGSWLSGGYLALAEIDQDRG